jgi:hypothetical protein
MRKSSLPIFFSVVTLIGCEKAVGMLAPSPGNFLDAWMRRQREIAAKEWPPMKGSPALLGHPREAVRRCVGKTDAVLLRCVTTLANVDAVSYPLFEACSSGPDSGLDLFGCAEFAMAFRPGGPSLGSPAGTFALCGNVVASDMPGCLLSKAKPREDVALRARLLSALATFRWLNEVHAAPTPEAIDPGIVKIRAQGSTPGPPSGEFQPPREHFSGEEFKELCRTKFQGNTESECLSLAADPGPVEAPRLLHRAAAGLCTSTAGKPQDSRASLECLAAASRRDQNGESLEACEAAFEPTHPGYLHFLRSCVSLAGHANYDTQAAETLGSMLAAARDESGASQHALAEKYEEIFNAVAR